MAKIEQLFEHKNYAARPVTITEMKPHPNADRLKIAVVGGENVIVDLNTQVGDRVVLFPLLGVDATPSEGFRYLFNWAKMFLLLFH